MSDGASPGAAPAGRMTPEPGDAPALSPYDKIARIYDPWSVSVVEDVAFYVEEAVRATGGAGGGAVVELGVGTGRIAVPTARAGVRVIGVDTSAGMLEVAREAAVAASVEALVDLRQGDMREPPVSERVALVTIPFRALLHMETEADRRRALAATRELLLPEGRLIFDVFSPGDDDIAETHGQWLEREPGIYERADWDTGSRTLTLGVRGPDGETTMCLAWISVVEWAVLLDDCGFDVIECYGWFDRRPYRGGEDSVWVAKRRG